MLARTGNYCLSPSSIDTIRCLTETSTVFLSAVTRPQKSKTLQTLHHSLRLWPRSVTKLLLGRRISEIRLCRRLATLENSDVLFASLASLLQLAGPMTVLV